MVPDFMVALWLIAQAQLEIEWKRVRASSKIR